MSAYPVRRISTATSLDDLARHVRGDIAAYGGAVRVTRHPPARKKLRRLMAALRADGYQAHYFTGDTGLHLLEVEPFGPRRRVVSLEAIS